MKSLPIRKDGIHYRNLCGPLIAKLRNRNSMSQTQLATRLQLLGCDMSRSRLSKIEVRLVWLPDYELMFIARALEVSADKLFPTASPQQLKRLVESRLKH